MEDQQQVTERDFNAVAAATAQKEAEAYELFGQRFDREFPKPPAPTVTMMQTIGWQFISIIIQSVFAIVLAALRTGSMFFEAAAGTNWGVQIAEAITAVGAIELGIVIFATIKSEIENSKTELTDLKSALKIDLRLLWTGIIACVGISVAAGLGVSFKGFGLELWWMKWIVAIAMGVGASLVAWVSGDILGAMLARWGNASALANLQYRHDLEEREDKKRQMWEAAPERQIARSELVELKEYIQANRYKAPKQARVTAVPQPIPQPAPRPRTSTRNNEVRIKVYDYLDRTWAMEQRIAGPTELVEQLGVSKGYVGGKDGVIQAWKTERNIPMPETTEELDAAQ